MAQPDFGPHPKQNAARALFGTTDVKVSEAMWSEIMDMLAVTLAQDGTQYPVSILLSWWNVEDFWRWPRIASAIKTPEFQDGLTKILSHNKSP